MRPVISALLLSVAVTGFSGVANASECEKTHTCPSRPVTPHKTTVPVRPPHRHYPVVFAPPAPTPTPTPSPPSNQTMGNYSLTWNIFPNYNGETHTIQQYAALIGKSLKRNGY